jgi:hypothetical protein
MSVCEPHARCLLAPALLLLLLADVLLHQPFKILEADSLQHHSVIEPVNAAGFATGSYN